MEWKLQEEKVLLEIYKMAKNGILNSDWTFAKLMWNKTAEIDHDWDASKMRLQNMLYCDTKTIGLSNAAKQTKKLIDDWKATINE